MKTVLEQSNKSSNLLPSAIKARNRKRFGLLPCADFVALLSGFVALVALVFVALPKINMQKLHAICIIVAPIVAPIP